MDAVLYIKCENQRDNFEYTKEISEDEYIKMLRDASDSILGQDGFSKRSTSQQHHGVYDFDEWYKGQQEMMQEDGEYLPFNAKLFNMNNTELTIQDIGYYYQSGKQFIVIVKVDEIENPIVEDTLNIWITNSDHVNNDDTLNDQLILKSLKTKDFKVKVNNNYFTFKYCKMVSKIDFCTFALLVNNLER